MNNVRESLVGLPHSSHSTDPLKGSDIYDQLGAGRALRSEGLGPVITCQALRCASGPSPSTECIVCRSEFHKDYLSSVLPTAACNHLPEVCIVCLRQIILTAVEAGSSTGSIRCPSSDCKQNLEYQDVQKWATAEVFDRFDMLLLRKALCQYEHYVFCPAPNCGAGQEHVGGESNNIVTCYSCGTKQCFTHQTKWHEGFTCAQWDEHMQISLEQQAMTEEWIQKETKPCSGPGCGKRIQKVDGCDHMTCRPPGGCGYQFCWFCLAPWLEIIAHDNSRHYDHCKHYTGLPGQRPAPPEMLAASTNRVVTPSTSIPAPPPIATPNTEEEQPIAHFIEECIKPSNEHHAVCSNTSGATSIVPGITNPRNASGHLRA